MTPQEKSERAELQELNERAELHQLNQRANLQENPSDDWGFDDEVVNAVTLGGAPRAQAFAKTLSDSAFDLYEGKDIDFSGSYDKNLSKTFRARDKYRKEHPWKSTGASFLGGAGSPLGNIVGKYMQGSKLAGSGLGKATNLRGRPPQLKDALRPLERPIGYKKPVTPPLPKIGLGETMKRGAVGGAGLAGTQGFMEAEGDLKQRGIEASKSAGMGSVLGGATPIVINTGSKILKNFADLISKAPGVINVGGRYVPGAKHIQTTLAWRKLAEALERDGYTLESAQKRLNQLGPNAVIGDLGDNVRSLAYSVYARPSKGSTKLRNFAESRQKGKFGSSESDVIKGGQTGRLQKKVEEMFPDKFKGAQNAEEATKAYRSAYANNQNIQSDVIDKIIESHNGRKAFKKAVEMMDDSGEFVGKNDPELTELWRMAEDVATPGGKGISSGLKLKTLDYFKRALQREEKMLIKNQDSDGARIINAQIKKVTKELDRLDATRKPGEEFGDYAKARRYAEIDFANKDANELGKKFMRNDVRLDDLNAKIADMNPEQLHNYRIGAMDTITYDLAKIKTGADKAQAILDNKLLQEKIKVVFGDDKKFGQYMRLLKNEAEMSKLRKTLGGSQTTKNQGAVDDSIIDPDLMTSGFLKMAGPNKLGGAMDIMKALRAKVFMREETADILGDALTSRKLGNINKKYRAREMTQPNQNALSRKIIQLGAPSLGKKRKSILSAQ